MESIREIIQKNKNKSDDFYYKLKNIHELINKDSKSLEKLIGLLNFYYFFFLIKHCRY